MSTSLLGLVSAILSVLLVIVLAVLAIIIGVTVKGRAAVAAILGLVLLVLERVIGVLSPMLLSTISSRSGSFAAFFVGQNVVLTLLELAGVSLLVLAVVWAFRDRRPGGPPAPRP